MKIDELRGNITKNSVYCKIKNKFFQNIFTYILLFTDNQWDTKHFRRSYLFVFYNKTTNVLPIWYYENFVERAYNKTQFTSQWAS